MRLRKTEIGCTDTRWKVPFTSRLPAVSWVKYITAHNKAVINSSGFPSQTCSNTLAREKCSWYHGTIKLHGRFCKPNWKLEGNTGRICNFGQKTEVCISFWMLSPQKEGRNWNCKQHLSSRGNLMEMFSYMCTYTARKGKNHHNSAGVKTQHWTMHIRHLTQAVIQVKTRVLTLAVEIFLILHASFS